MMGDGPNSNAKWSKYTIDGESLVRNGEFCPACGPGVFLGVHNDRIRLQNCRIHHHSSTLSLG